MMTRNIQLRRDIRKDADILLALSHRIKKTLTLFWRRGVMKDDGNGFFAEEGCYQDQV